ncbi:hypothetical protein RGQ29_026102 [Quercus rubra]|uniref:Uncharacterized protein n=1 Tax=Quercus rubra TaxID=3512 RepID=A0AAN7F062_QUERU|nr:hypothetical protein RGQ29_026102 [Quercus rubra]
MEKYFGNAYRGDPGVPHADPDRFVNIWIGSAAFSALTWFNPYMWHLTNQFNHVIAYSLCFLFTLHEGHSSIELINSVCACVQTRKLLSHPASPHVGMTELSYLSSTTGKRQWRRSSLMSSCGISAWTRTTVIHIILIGLFTSLRLFFYISILVLFCNKC